MCGRFALATDQNLLDLLFDLERRPEFDLRPRYNIAPGQPVAAVRLSATDGKRELVNLKWGLVPFWASEAKVGQKMINARSETAAEKPAFRSAFKQRRLLIPASGFFEWKKEKEGKQPFYIYPARQKLFTFAGLWERWDKAGEVIESCTILTTAANELVAPLHDRMPVIIPPNDFKHWLDPAAPLEKLKALTVPLSPEHLSFHPVSTLINSPANDHPELITALDPKGQKRENSGQSRLFD